MYNEHRVEVDPQKFKLIKSNDIRILIRFIEDEPLLILDIDNTVLELSQLLGTPEWFMDFYKKQLSQGIESNKAMKNTVEIYVKVNKISDAKVVDPMLPSILREIQLNKIPVLGLTSRDDGLYSATHRQLKAGGIDFNKGIFKNKRFRLKCGERSEVRKGIIYAGGEHKGFCLKEFISTTGWMPRKIVFVDDQLKYIEEVKECTDALNIPCIGFHYTFLENKIKNINSKIHEIQLEHLNKYNKIISDVEAQALLDSMGN